jgi:type VI protein secretion system component Hcp
MRPLLRRTALAGIALAAVVGLASPASAAQDKSAGTLSIENVGSSPILAWSWGVSNTTTIGGSTGGAGAGKVVLEDFSLTKRIDPLSTELTRAAATGTNYPEVVVSIPMGGPMSPFAIEYKLKPVFVSSLQQSGSGDESTESVSLTYGAFEQNIGTNARFGWAGNG